MRLGLREAAALAVNRKAERIQAIWRGYSARKRLFNRSAHSLLAGRSWPLARSFLASVLAHPDSTVHTEAVHLLDTCLYHAVWQFTALGDGAFDLFREDSGRSPVRVRVVDRPDWHVHADAVSVEEAVQLEFVLRPLVCERGRAKRQDSGEHERRGFTGPPSYLETRDGRCFRRRIPLRTAFGNRLRKERSERRQRPRGERWEELGLARSMNVPAGASVVPQLLTHAAPLQAELSSIATPRGGAPAPVDSSAVSGPTRQCVATCDVARIRMPGWPLGGRAVW